MMRFLDQLELYMTEAKEPYDIVPVDFDEEHGVSFSIQDDGTPVAEVMIKTIDGVPMDALGGGYNYDDVYADVSMVGDTDDPANSELINWITNKVKNLGYDENSIRIDGREIYKKSEGPTLPKDTEETDTEELQQSDSDIDITNYWDDGSEENSSEEVGGEETPELETTPEEEPSLEDDEEDEEDDEKKSEG